MLCLTCHQPCRENLSHPLSYTPKHINKHTHRVPSHQSATAEVTRQVAANKALRGQLQEKEDKLRQLQDKLVFTPFSSLVLCLCAFFLTAYFLALFCFPFFFLHPSFSLSLRLPASPSACVHNLCSSHL